MTLERCARRELTETRSTGVAPGLCVFGLGQATCRKVSVPRQACVSRQKSVHFGAAASEKLRQPYSHEPRIIRAVPLLLMLRKSAFLDV